MYDNLRRECEDMCEISRNLCDFNGVCLVELETYAIEAAELSSIYFEAYLKQFDVSAAASAK